MKRRDFVGCVGLGAAALVLGRACLPEDTVDVRRRLLRSWTSELAVGEYRQLVSASEELGDRASELRQGGSDDQLIAVREAWDAARAPLKRAELFGFGPYLEEPERYGPKLDFWPVRPDAIEAVLGGEGALNSTSVQSLGASTKGLPALEYLLWAPGVAAQDFMGTRRGDYVVALAAELGRVGELLIESWTTGFAERISEAGDTHVDLFPTLPAALGAVLNQVAALVELVRIDKLGRPLGDNAGGVPQPEKAESRYSERSTRDILDNLTGIGSLLFGRADPDVLGLSRYLSRLKPGLEARVRTTFDTAKSACEAIELPLTQAIVDAPSEVRGASDALGALQRIIQVDVLGSLSVSVSFANDGD